MRAAFPLVVALLLFAAAMWMPPAAYALDWSVDLDGSGDFTSIGAAIEAAPRSKDAPISVAPASRAVTRPAASMLATEGIVLDQVTSA